MRRLPSRFAVRWTSIGISTDKLKLLGVLRSYKQQREQWLDADYVAVGVMDYYFEEAGCKV